MQWESAVAEIIRQENDGQNLFEKHYNYLWKFQIRKYQNCWGIRMQK